MRWLKTVARWTRRTLSLLIVKNKACGGFVWVYVNIHPVTKVWKLHACVKQWNWGFRHWVTCNVMSIDRVNYKVFRWAFTHSINQRKKWCYRILTKFRECNIKLYANLGDELHKNVKTRKKIFYLINRRQI